MGKEINPQDILTPQEDYLLGGTPVESLIIKESDFYTPYGILTKKLTKDEVISLRKEKGHFIGLALYNLLSNNMALSLEEIDSENLTTIKDPQVIEIKPDNSTIVRNDLTEAFYTNYEATFKNYGRTFEGRLRHNQGK